MVYDLDIIPNGKTQKFFVSQFDNERKFSIKLNENGLPFSLLGDETLTLQVSTPDNEYIEAEIENNGGDIIKLVVSDDITGVAGTCYCKINIDYQNKSISTSAFYIIIEKKP